MNKDKFNEFCNLITLALITGANHSPLTQREQDVFEIVKHYSETNNNS